MDVLEFILPFPPSINHYYMHTSKGIFINSKGKLYRKNVILLLNKLRNYFSESDRLEMSLIFHPPDKRKRDIDNLVKACWDAIQYSGVFHDDSQIDKLTVTRGQVVKGGMTHVTLKLINSKID